METLSKLVLTISAPLILLAACSEQGQEDSSPKPAQQHMTADIVMTNGYVYTVDEKQSVKEAVAIAGNEIIYVGDNKGVKKHIAEKTDVRDLGGRMLMPGIHDTHIHAAGIADVDICDLKNQSMTLEELVPFIQACLEKYEIADGEWLVIAQWGFSYGNQPSARLPTLRAALDAASAKHPLMLYGNDGHHAAVNSMALAMAKDKQGNIVGINKVSLNSDFAEFKELIAVDEQGEPSGGISEVARFLVKEDFMKEYQYLTAPAEVMMPMVTEKLAWNGITSILEAYVETFLLDYYRWLAEAGEMTFRARLTLYGDVKDSLDENAAEQIPGIVKQVKGMQESMQDYPYIQANAVKLLVDGVLEGDPYAVPPTLPVAAVLGEFKQPIFSFDTATEQLQLTGYVDTDSDTCKSVRINSEQFEKPGSLSAFIEQHGFHPAQCKKASGVLEHDETFISEYIRQFTEAGFHVHLHALSDKAVRLSMDAFESVKEKADELNLTQSISHAQLVHPGDVVRLGKLGVYVAFTYAWMDPDREYDTTVIPFIEQLQSLDELYKPDHYYLQNAYPVKSVKDAGGILTWGSDAPVEYRDPRPFKNLQLAVTREAQGQVLNEEEVISIHDAIAAFTINGARFLGHDNVLGSIEVGKTADLVVLNQNVVELAERGLAERIGETLVELTIFDGKIIFER